MAATTQPALTPMTVLDAAGQPEADATVVVVPAPATVRTFFVFDGNLKPRITFPYRQCRTDATGQCRVQRGEGPGSVIAFGAAGWARTKLAALPNDGVIRLQPWARVSGRLMTGSRPQAGQWIVVRAPLLPADLMADRAMVERSAVTDADGRFVIDRVPPEAVRVEHLIQSNGLPATADSGGVSASSVTVNLSPGQALDITLGGSGRPVTGSVTLPAGIVPSEIAWEGFLKHRPASVELPMPPAVKNGTAEARAAWMNTFKQSEAYAAASDRYLQELRSVPLHWTNGTTFRVDDVTAGDYTLDITGRRSDGTVYRSSAVKVVVPEMKDGRSDEPLPITPVALHRGADKIAVGRPAPDFSVVSLDGKAVKLSDYRGKTVLVDFWSMSCPPCIVQMPALRALHEQYAGTGRFTLLSISCDETAAEAMAYVDAQQLSWTQTWIGDPASPVLSEAYPGGLPMLVLIDTDGTVLAMGHDLDVVRTVLGRHLAKR